MLICNAKRGGTRSTNAMENDSPRTIDTFVKREPSCGFAFGRAGRARNIFFFSIKSATKSKGSSNVTVLRLPPSPSPSSLPRPLVLSAKDGVVAAACREQEFELNHWEQLCGSVTFGRAEGHVTPMSRRSVSASLPCAFMGPLPAPRS